MSILAATDRSFHFTLPVQTVNTANYTIDYVKGKRGFFQIVKVNHKSIDQLSNSQWFEVCAFVENI